MSTMTDATPEHDPKADMNPVGRYLLYTLSLPERALRSGVVLTAGAAREATSFLVPKAFQDSKTYEIVIANSLKFLTDEVGGAAPREGEGAEDAMPDGYVARKAVGNFLDLAGLATLHLSPVWLLAIVSDVAYGSKTYVAELARELEKQGIIDESSTIHHVDDVLDAVRRGSGNAASLFDTPPLSADDLKRTLDETREALSGAQYTELLSASEIQRYWAEMKDIAEREQLDLLDVSAAMTMHTVGKVTDVTRSTFAGLKVAGGLLTRNVLGHYWDSLRTIREKGFYETVSDSYGPYVGGVWNNFSSDSDTVTEQVFSGRLPARMWRAVRGWFSKKKP